MLPRLVAGTSRAANRRHLPTWRERQRGSRGVMPTAGRSSSSLVSSSPFIPHLDVVLDRFYHYAITQRYSTMIYSCDRKVKGQVVVLKSTDETCCKDRPSDGIRAPLTGASGKRGPSPWDDAWRGAHATSPRLPKPLGGRHASFTARSAGSSHWLRGAGAGRTTAAIWSTSVRGAGLARRRNDRNTATHSPGRSRWGECPQLASTTSRYSPPCAAYCRKTARSWASIGWGGKTAVPGQRGMSRSLPAVPGSVRAASLTTRSWSPRSHRMGTLRRTSASAR